MLFYNRSDQFARAFHRGSRPGSAVSGNAPSPIDHVQEPLYDNYADDQLYKGPQAVPEGTHWQLCILNEWTNNTFSNNKKLMFIRAW